MTSTDPPVHREHLPEVDGIVDLERIGRGGFARVYRGWQTDMRRPVAVKVLDGVVDDPESDRRFRREVAAMGAASHHPNVVAIYATGVTSDGHPLLVMSYLPGGSLADRIREGPLDPATVVDIGTKMAAALSAAHESGVLHRDVKPSNILFSAYGEPHLADFGIARLADATRTNASQIVATVAYAPPEILSGETASAASDVYSLAATLYTALAGTPPFTIGTGEPLAASVARVVGQPPPDLRASGVPDQLAGVIARAMAKSPAERTPTAEQFRQELAGAIGGGTVPATGATVAMATPEQADELSEPVWRGERRRPVLIASALVFLLVVAIAVAALRSGDGGHSAAKAAPTTSTRVASTTSPPSTAAPTTATASTTAPRSTAPRTAPTTTATTAPTTARPSSPTSVSPATSASGTPASSDPGAATPQATVTQYYQLLDGGNIDRGFTWLTPAYQARTGGIGSYRSFWQGIRSVQASNIATPSPGVVQATLRYTKVDGSVSVERVELGLVRSASTGNFLIDSYRVI